MMVKGYKVSFWGDEKCSRMGGGGWWLHNSVNTPKAMELYTLNRGILWYVN